MTGASLVANGVQFDYIGRQLAPLPGTEDTPVDVPGVNNDVGLAFTGDFSITAKIIVPLDADAYFELWGYIPMIQDEWRALNNSITMEFMRWGPNSGTIWWTSHDRDWFDTSGFEDIDFGANDSEITVVFQRVGTQLTATANGTQFLSLADNGFFPDNRMYFSLYSDATTPYTATSIVANAIGAGTVQRLNLGAKPVAQSTTSLRYYAERNYPNTYIGSCVSAHPLAMDENYAAVFGREFNQLTPENAFKFQMIQPAQGVFDFGEADMIMEFARLNGMAVHGHALVWQEAIPMWMHNGSFTAQQVQTIMVNHINTVVGRYAGRIESWDIINEPFEGFTADLRVHVWQTAMGRDFIKIALNAAHAADPNALLFINEWGCEEPGTKQDALFALCQELLAEGVPIHGIGFQMHEDMNADYQVDWDPDSPSVNKPMLKAAIARFKSIGITARVSELDVNMHQIYPTTLQAQADYYQSIMEACLEEGAHAFCMWGFTDRWSSLQGWWDYHAYGNGLIFDVNYNPKQPYIQMNERLRTPA